MMSAGVGLFSGMYTFLILTGRFNWEQLLQSLTALCSVDSERDEVTIQSHTQGRLLEKILFNFKKKNCNNHNSMWTLDKLFSKGILSFQCIQHVILF